MERMRASRALLFAACALVITVTIARADIVTGAQLEQNKVLVKRFFASFDQTVATGVPDPQLDSIVAADYVQHEQGIAPGLAGLKAYLVRLHGTIPDLSCKVTDMAAEGDRVVDRTACTYHDVKTNQTATDITVDAFRISGGKLAEHTNWSE